MKCNGVIQRKLDLITQRVSQLRSRIPLTRLFVKSSNMDNVFSPTADSAATQVDLVALSAYLARDSRVTAATILGSAQDGCVRPGSDIDIAVLFREPLAPEQ